MKLRPEVFLKTLHAIGRSLCVGPLSGRSGERPLVKIAMGMLLALSASAATPAQADSPEGISKAQFNGAWLPQQPTFLFNLAPLFAAEDPESPTPPLKGEYLRQFELTAARLRRIKSGGPLEPGEGTFRPEVNCPPASMPQMMLVGFQLAVTGPIVYIMGDGHGSVGSSGAVRHIFLNQTKHPVIAAKDSSPQGADYVPGYVGHSIGRWEGNVLLIDTVGLKENRIDGQEEMPQARHSDALHIKERMRLVSKDVLEDEITLEDAKALTTPWVSTVRYRRIPVRQADGSFEYCEANAGAREF